MRGFLVRALWAFVAIEFALVCYSIPKNSDSTATPVTNTTQTYPPPADLLTSKQMDKLNLEIEGLRKQNDLAPWPQFAPLIVAALGLAGLAFTIFQFQAGQKKDRLTRELDQRTRLQNQLRNDIDQILLFTRDEKQTVSRVSFLLEDMKTVLRSQVNEKQTVSDVFPHYERSLTKSLVKLVRDDCDFTKNPRDVGLAHTIIHYWNDYSDYLNRDLKKLHYILYEYIRAFQALRTQNPGYLENLKINPQTDEYEVSPEYEAKEGEAILYNTFIDIRDGFIKHLEILGDEGLSEEAKQLKRTIAQAFHNDFGNKLIADDILPPSFRIYLASAIATS
jgi:hypothetical protein